jgi:hypothetical protein
MALVAIYRMYLPLHMNYSRTKSSSMRRVVNLSGTNVNTSIIIFYKNAPVVGCSVSPKLPSCT